MCLNVNHRAGVAEGKSPTRLRRPWSSKTQAESKRGGARRDELVAVQQGHWGVVNSPAARAAVSMGPGRSLNDLMLWNNR